MALEVRDVSKVFPGITALDGVSIAFEPGTVHALVGENGAGKSTLIKTLAGRHRPDAGDIRWDGTPVELRNPLDASRFGISVVYQEYNLVPLLTVLDNVLLGREPLGRTRTIDRGAERRLVLELEARMGVSISPDAYVADLGAAEAKIVEIMKALAGNARVLILDEPTAALPEKDVEGLFEVIRGLRSDGVTVIYISHRLDEIFQIADAVSVLKDGRLVGTWKVGEIDRDFLVRSMVGRELRDVYPPRAAAVGDTVLEARGLSDGGVLRDVSLDVHAGEIVGIGGMSGHGQRECLRTLFGAAKLASGEIRYRGRRVRIPNPAAALGLGIGFIPDDRRNDGLSVGQSVLRNLALPSLDLRQTAGVISTGRERTTGQEVVAELDIRVSSLGQPVASLSGGNQQRVVIGKWLPLSPSVLLFHEPTLGIDVGARMEIYRLMRELTAKGVAILMVTSDMIELLNVPDRILVFWEGRVAAEFRGGEATEQDVMHAASGGTPPAHAASLLAVPAGAAR